MTSGDRGIIGYINRRRLARVFRHAMSNRLEPTNAPRAYARGAHRIVLSEWDLRATRIAGVRLPWNRLGAAALARGGLAGNGLARARRAAGAATGGLAGRRAAGAGAARAAAPADGAAAARRLPWTRRARN